MNMIKTLAVILSLCPALRADEADSSDDRPEVTMQSRTIEEFTRTTSGDRTVYSADAEGLNLKCEGNQRVKIRLGETKDVVEIRVDGKVFRASGEPPHAFDVTGSVVREDAFPPLVSDFRLEIVAKTPKTGAAPGQPTGPVEVAVVFSSARE